VESAIVWPLATDDGIVVVRRPADGPRARMPGRVPVVLSRDEIARIMKHLEGVTWIIVALLYGAGMRLHECLELRVKDIDLERRQIVIRRGHRRAFTSTNLSSKRSRLSIRANIRAHSDMRSEYESRRHLRTAARQMIAVYSKSSYTDRDCDGGDRDSTLSAGGM